VTIADWRLVIADFEIVDCRLRLSIVDFCQQSSLDNRQSSNPQSPIANPQCYAQLNGLV